MSINRVIISGNLTRDPELRSTQSGMDVMSFGVAVNDRRRNPQTNEWEDYPNFVDCTMFGNHAEAQSRILRKGMKVAIEGKLRYSSWEDKNGGRRSKLEVIPDEVELLSQNPNAQQGQPPEDELAAGEVEHGHAGAQAAAHLVGAQGQLGRQAGKQQGGDGDEAAAARDGIEEARHEGGAGTEKDDSRADHATIP